MRYAKLAVAFASVLLTTMALAAILAQRKCQADTLMYALSFDCATVKDVIRFLMFSYLS